MASTGNADDIRRAITARQAFTPSVPVKSRDLFAGRVEHLLRLLHVQATLGQHAVIFGERGVGKTSIARILKIMQEDVVTSAYASCEPKDTFADVWRRVFEQINVASAVKGRAGFVQETAVETVPLTRLIEGSDYSIGRVAEVLTLVAVEQPVTVFIDEFDRCKEKTRAPFADLIKRLADFHAPVTLVLIGVADDVEELVHQHQSVGRNLEQVKMPRMNDLEIHEVITRGLDSVGMAIDSAALQRVQLVSCGLPYVTHQLMSVAAYTSASGQRTIVTLVDVEKGISAAVQASDQTLTSSYLSATTSEVSSRYRDVLFALAMSVPDREGYVTPAVIRGNLPPAADGKPQSSSWLSTVLRLLTQPNRGGVVCMTGAARRHRYRFTMPLMQSYVLMQALGPAARDAA